LPLSTSPLHLRDDIGNPISVHLPSDNVIGRSALSDKYWDISKPRFVDQLVRSAGDRFCLVDVGANVGLFSRQCLTLSPAIASLYAYEPHPVNFSLLTRNLQGIDRVQLSNFGLGNVTSTLDLYADSKNAGNYSLHLDAMPPSFSKLSVNIVRASDEEPKWLQHGIPIIYKSDTQGFDETIATSLSADFWSNVRGGIFELWRIEGKEYDKESFARILDRFANKVFEKHPNQNVTSAAIMRYLDSVDHQFDDLLFWR
jgi:FkbM family methyltransferase